MYTIVYRDKNIFTSTTHNIYQSDNRVYNIRFLIDTENENINISNFNTIVQIILPDGQSGKLDYLNFETELYNNRYLIAYLPVTKTLTTQVGQLEINLSFFMHDEVNDIYYTMNTNSTYLKVLKSNVSSGSITPEDETDILSSMQSQIDALETSKATCMDYNEITRELTLYADIEKTTILTIITLTDDVTWSLL